MSKTYLGIQDYPDTAPKWLDASVSFSWLRAFEQIDASAQKIAYLREIHYHRDMISPVRGVRYRFRNAPLFDWAADIVGENPDVVLYNLCEYKSAAPAVSRLVQMLKSAKHVIRLHHELEYLITHFGFRECLLGCDVAIAATAAQGDKLREYGFRGQIETVPFGVDTKGFRARRRGFADRDIDVICANAEGPQKNTQLLREVFSRLTEDGYRALHVGGLDAHQLGDVFGRSKIIFQPSMSEASGSRILMEGIAAGCLPVALWESATTREIAVEHGGIALASGSKFEMRTLTIANPPGAGAKIAREIAAILRGAPTSGWPGIELSPGYDAREEIRALVEIVAEDKTPRNRRDGPMGRAAAALLGALGVDPDQLDERGLTDLASKLSRTAQPDAASHRAARAICAAMQFDEGYWGLRAKIFRPDFQFADEMNWIIATVMQAC